MEPTGKKIKLIPPASEKTHLACELLGLQEVMVFDCLSFLEANSRILSYNKVTPGKARLIFERLAYTLATCESIYTIAKVTEAVIICYPNLSPTFLEVLSDLIKNGNSVTVVGRGRPFIRVSLQFLVGVVLGIFHGAIHNNHKMDALNYRVLMNAGFNEKLFGVLSSVVFHQTCVVFERAVSKEFRDDIADSIKTYVRFSPLDFDLRAAVLSGINDIRIRRKKEKEQGKEVPQMGASLLKSVIYGYLGRCDADEQLDMISMIK